MTAAPPFLALVIFAAEPTWTDKEVLYAIGSVLATVLTAGVSIGILAFKHATRAARVRAMVAEQERKQLQSKLDALQVPEPTPGPTLSEVQAKLVEAQSELGKFREVVAEHAERLMIDQLAGTLSALQATFIQYESDLAAERRRVKRALQKDGQTWTQRVLANAPEFKSLDPELRRTPILSVLNLKGGVGKTTLTANLAAALDGLGYRVLVLDLDLQGSLTGLFMEEARHYELAEQDRLMEDFLALSFGSEFPNLLDYTHAVLPSGRSGLVPTSDSLAYAELNLTVRWLLREGNRDVRFLLRRELHLKRVTNNYDVVLMDCPPLINVCCVNALAASDYLLIPVMPSKQATARVPVLLKRLKGFRENINPELKILGVIANRTHRSGLTADEENRLSALRNACKDIWGQDVPRFDTAVRQNTEIRDAEDAHRPLREGEEMYAVFRQLAEEVISRLPAFCHPGAAPRPLTVKEPQP